MDENVDTSVTQSKFDHEATQMLMAEFLESAPPGENVLVSVFIVYRLAYFHSEMASLHTGLL